MEKQSKTNLKTNSKLKPNSESAVVNEETGRAKKKLKVPPVHKLSEAQLSEMSLKLPRTKRQLFMRCCVHRGKDPDKTLAVMLNNMEKRSSRQLHKSSPPPTEKEQVKKLVRDLQNKSDGKQSSVFRERRKPRELLNKKSLLVKSANRRRNQQRAEIPSTSAWAPVDDQPRNNDGAVLTAQCVRLLGNIRNMGTNSLGDLPLALPGTSGVSNVSPLVDLPLQIPLANAAGVSQLPGAPMEREYSRLLSNIEILKILNKDKNQDRSGIPAAAPSLSSMGFDDLAELQNRLLELEKLGIRPPTLWEEQDSRERTHQTSFRRRSPTPTFPRSRSPRRNEFVDPQRIERASSRLREDLESRSRTHATQFRRKSPSPSLAGCSSSRRYDSLHDNCDRRHTSSTRRSPTPTSERNMQRSTASFAEDSRTPRTPLYIVPITYPNQRLSDEEIDRIENSILQTILATDHENMKPTFKESFRSHGRYGVVCNDQFSEYWLHRYLSTYQLGPNAYLKIIKPEPAKIRAIAELPLSKNDDNNVILKFIAKQNTNLNASGWEVVQRWDGDRSTSVTFLVDEDSARKLRTNGKINFKMGSAHIDVKDSLDAEDEVSSMRGEHGTQSSALGSSFQGRNENFHYESRSRWDRRSNSGERSCPMPDTVRYTEHEPAERSQGPWNHYAPNQDSRDMMDSGILSRNQQSERTSRSRFQEDDYPRREATEHWQNDQSHQHGVEQHRSVRESDVSWDQRYSLNRNSDMIDPDFGFADRNQQPEYGSSRSHGFEDSWDDGRGGNRIDHSRLVESWQNDQPEFVQDHARDRQVDVDRSWNRTTRIPTAGGSIRMDTERLTSRERETQERLTSRNQYHSSRSPPKRDRFSRDATHSHHRQSPPRSSTRSWSNPSDHRRSRR